MDDTHYDFSGLDLSEPLRTQDVISESTTLMILKSRTVVGRDRKVSITRELEKHAVLSQTLLSDRTSSWLSIAI